VVVLFSYLQVAVARRLLSQRDELSRALLGHFHQISGDRAGSGVDRGLPQEDQGLTSDLAEAQVVGGAWRMDNINEDTEV